MDRWAQNAPPLGRDERAVGKLTQHLLGDDIEFNVTRALSLFRFLATHANVPARTLRTQIVDDAGKPLFTERDIQDMLETLKKYKDSAYVRRITQQTGGSSAGSAPLGSAPLGSAAPVDPTRSKFWDAFIRKLSHSAQSYLPEVCSGWAWYLFMLYNLEQSELFGPFLSTALDTVTLSLPVLSDLAGNVVEQLAMLAPIPYAGLAGQVFAYMIGLVFLLFALFLNMSRRHFGSAFKVSLEMIPLFGDLLVEAAQNFETGAERFLANRQRLVQSLQRVSPSTGAFVDYYVPTLEIRPPTPAPEWSINTLKANVARHVAKRVDELTPKLPQVPPVLTAVATAATAGGGSRRKTRRTVRRRRQ